MYTKRLAKSFFGLLQAMTAGLTLLAVSSGSFAVEIDTAAILECRSMQDDASRLACYDSIELPPLPSAGNVEAEAPLVAKPGAKEPPVAEPEELDDAIGQETLSREEEKLAVRGHVVSCRPDATGKYLFYFGNGQIWQQKDNKRIRWKKCEFDVTISKDFFGYKMLPDGEKQKIRIARVN
jgi:hypothetical protein